MAKCDSCNLLNKRVNGRNIMCKDRGMTHQRREVCNKYKSKDFKIIDLLGWCD